MRAKRQAGLTLIELVAALALLAMIVTASLPVLQEAARSLQSNEPAVAVEDLGMLADRMLSDPEAFGIEPLHAFESAQIEWPTDLLPDATSDAVTVELVRIEETDHAWLRFSAGEAATLRWIKLEEEP